MIPLRVAATCGCALGLAYGAVRGAQPTVIVNALMLALNFWRLMEMRRLDPRFRTRRRRSTRRGRKVTTG